MLYNSKFILMATSLGTNAVGVTRIFFVMSDPILGKTYMRVTDEAELAETT